MKLLISGLAIGGFAITSVAANLYVPSILYPTIASAMLNANSGDTIVLYSDPNPRAEPQVVLREGVSIVGASSDRSDVTIYPAGDYTLFVATDLEETASIKSLTVDIPTGRSNSRALSATSSSIALENVYINGCVASAEGGAIRAFDCELTLTNFTVWGSHAGGSAGVNHGGGIWAYSTSLSMSNGSIGGCEAVDGAGLYFVGVDENLTPTFDLGFNMEYVDFLGNIAAGDGGGAWLGQFYSLGNHSIHGSSTNEINDNSAGDHGGGFYMADGSADIDSLNFLYNDAVYGGGLYCANSTQLTDVAFRSNTARYRGGGAYLQGGTLINTNFISNEAKNTANGNQFYGGGLYSEANALILTNCEFRSNTVSVEATGSPVSRSAMGGGVFVNDGMLSAQNCLFNSNTIEAAGTATYHNAFGGAVYAAEDASFEHCTFALNATSADAAGVQIGGSAIASFGLLELLMCNISDNVSSDTEQGQVHQNSGDYDIAVTYTNVTGNLENEWIGVLAGHLQDTGNLNVESRFVDTEASDFRLKWNSGLMDAGVFEENDLDYDLTADDIGWVKPYVEVPLAGTYDYLAPGHYLVTGTTTVTISSDNLTISPGAIIRVPSSAKLWLTTPTDGSSIYIGAEDGARTAFVGATTLNPLAADIGDGITIGNPYAQDIAQVIAEGVLFNVAVELVSFYNCSVEMIGAELPAQQNCDFRNYLQASLYFRNSNGEFSHHNFANGQLGNGITQAGLTDIFVAYSDMDLKSIDFGTGNDSYGSHSDVSIVVYGAPVYPTDEPDQTEIAQCNFSGDGGYINAIISSTEAGLSGNKFMDGEVEALVASSATVYMGDDHGNNQFLKQNSVLLTKPLISTYGPTELILKCGYNAFVQPQREQTNFEGFIQSTLDAQHPPANTVWIRNYWGTGLESGSIDPLITCDNPTGCDLPSWAEWDPVWPNTGFLHDDCDSDDEETLFELAKNAQKVYNYGLAVGLFMEILLEHSQSVDAPLAAGYIKSIGLNTGWGANNAETVVASLLQAADTAWVEEPELGIEESTSAWVVEGLHGDREQAVAELDSLLAVCLSASDTLFVLNGKAEVESFGAQGGVSSQVSGSNAVFALAQRQQDFLAGLVQRFSATAQTSEPIVEALPMGFELRSAVPNPFNPVTRLDIVVTTAGNFTVNLFNIQGQLVQNLRTGMLPVGESTIVVDGSAFASGVYFVEVHSAQGRQSQKLLLVK